MINESFKSLFTFTATGNVLIFSVWSSFTVSYI